MIDADAPVAAWLHAGLAMARVAESTGAGWDRRSWFRVVLDAHAALPPPGCVVDLAAMALGAPDRPRRLPGDDATLRAAVRAWDDEVLARLRADPALVELQDALAALPAPLRAEAAGEAAAGVLGAIGAPGRTVVPAALRRALDGAPPLPDPDAAAALREGYRALTTAARGVPRLIPAATVAIVRHLPVLRTREARVTLGQLAARAAERPPLPPRRPRGGAAPRPAPAAGAFPIGGLHAIQTRGVLENLVPSELVYMDDGPGVDLFDRRWADGELLYYARDEGMVHRAARAVCIALDPSLDAARTPGPDGVQPVVTLLGRVAAAVRALDRSAEALRVHVVAPPDGLTVELPLLALLLQDLTERRVLTMARGDADSAQRWAAGHAHTHLVRHVVVGAEGRSGPDAVGLDVDAAALLAKLA